MCICFQVKKLLNKPVVRESCFYRKLTDRAKDEAALSFSDIQLDNLLGETRNRNLSPPKNNKSTLTFCLFLREPSSAGRPQGQRQAC